MDDNNQNDIEKYILHKMDEHERAAFEKKMEEDSKLKEDVLLEINIHKAFNEKYDADSPIINDQELINTITAELRTKELKEASDFIRKSTLKFKTKKKTSLKLIYKYTAAVAAMLLLVFMLKATLDSDTTYEKYANWNDLPSLIEKGTEKNNLNKIEQAFNTKDYNNVILMVADTKDPYQLIYKGVSYVKQENYPAAEQVFNTLIATKSLESSRGYWYNFLIYLKQDKIVEAKKMLAKTLESKHNFNYKIALELVDNL